MSPPPMPESCLTPTRPDKTRFSPTLRAALHVAPGLLASHLGEGPDIHRSRHAYSVWDRCWGSRRVRSRKEVLLASEQYFHLSRIVARMVSS